MQIWKADWEKVFSLHLNLALKSIGMTLKNRSGSFASLMPMEAEGKIYSSVKTKVEGTNKEYNTY